MHSDYFVSRLAADRYAELREVSAQIRLQAYLRRVGRRPRIVAWFGLKLAAAGTKLAGMRTVQDLERLACAECS